MSKKTTSENETGVSRSAEPMSVVNEAQRNNPVGLTNKIKGLSGQLRPFCFGKIKIVPNLPQFLRLKQIKHNLK